MFQLIHLTIFSVLLTTIQGQPQLQIIPKSSSFVRALGTNFMFTCEISEVGPQAVNTNLQWFDKDSREITETAGGGRLVYVEKDEHSPTKKLYFTQIKQEHAGLYTCSGVVEGNRQSQNVTLLLYQPITYDNAPSPQYPVINSEGLIQCRVSGQPIPTVSWRYMGSKITTGGRYFQDQYGLHIRNITKADDGIYTCRAEVDAEGHYDERDITVTVYTPPTVQQRQTSYTGIQSQQFVISCRANGHPNPKYEFTKGTDTNPLYNTDRRQVDADAGDISFRALHKEDEGVYNCKAYNDAGFDRGQISLTVHVPPTIDNLRNVTGSETHAVTLVCTSVGDPPPAMTFRKSSSIEPYSMGSNENGRIVVSSPERGRLELLINNLDPSDMSNYTCASHNDVGSHEKNGTITVEFKPRFPTDHISRVYIWAGKTRNITCHVLAEPMPVIEWKRFQYALVDNETFRIYNMGKNSNLQVKVREVDQGWIYGNYTCLARNQQGESNIKILLQRASTPGTIKSVVTIETLSNLARFSIEPPSNDGGVEVLGYQIEYEARTLDFQIGDDIFVENLRPSTTFLLHFRARNEVGLGPPFPHTIQTQDVSVPEKLIITSDRQSNGLYEYTVTWLKPNTGGLPIRQYEFRLREVVSDAENILKPVSDWVARRVEDDEHRPMMYYVLLNLKPETMYQLEVMARNDIGWSTPSDEFHFTTSNYQGGLPTPGRVSAAIVCSRPPPVLYLVLVALCCHVSLTTVYLQRRKHP